MANNRMCFKIISCLLIQSFIAWDLCWAAGTGPIQLSKTTLAPAVSINKVDLKGAFDEISDAAIESDDLFGAGNESYVNINKENFKEPNSKSDDAQEMTIMPPASSSAVNNNNSGGVNAAGTLSEIWPPPPDTNVENTLNTGSYNKTLGFWTNQDELEKELEKKYGLAVDSGVLTKTELIILLKTLQAIVAKDNEFRAKSAAIAPLRVSRSSTFVEYGRREVNQLAKIVYPEKGEPYLILYDSFFYKWFYWPQNIEERKASLQQEIISYAYLRLIGGSAKEEDLDKRIVSMTKVIEGDPDAKEKLLEIGVPLEMHKIAIHVAQYLKQKNDPVFDHRFTQGFDDVMILQPAIFSAPMLKISLAAIGLSVDGNISDEQFAKFYQALTQQAEKAHLTEINLKLLNNALLESGFVIQKETQRIALVNSINKTLSELKNEKRMWVVEHYQDGNKIKTRFCILTDSIRYLYLLSQEVLMYKNPKIWKIKETDVPTTLLHVILDSDVWPHEGLGHSQQVPLNKATEALPIPWNEFASILNKQAREIALIDFFYRLANWDFPAAVKALERKGEKYFIWGPASLGISNALKLIGHVPYFPGPKEFTDAVLKEVHANARVHQVSGNWGLAYGQWFFHVFCTGEEYLNRSNETITNYLKTRCTFCTAADRNQIKRYVQEIDTIHRKNIGQKTRVLPFSFENEKENTFIEISANSAKKSLWRNIFSVVLIGLLTFTEQLHADDGTLHALTQSHNAGFISAGAIIVIAIVALQFSPWLRNKAFWNRSPEQRTVQLVNQAIRTGDTTKLRNFYQQANLAERSAIISAMGRELNARQQRVEVFEPIFRDALETSPRHIAR
ncbi:MAG: hypothetical protein PHO30_06285, partial [Candidatus Omnitrophica bacterium]|nr:hypothetical protein [Candidatus Omnitrophota bacterium]